MIRTFLLLLALCAAGPAAAERVVIFAAASLKGPLDDALASYEGEAVVSYGASSALARQIAAGAPADMFLSANVAWAEAVAEGETIPFLGNTLVLVGPQGVASLDLTPEAFAARLDGNRMAIALTAAVPAGIYGREALESLALWDGVSDQLAETVHVRAALALVVRGEVPLALVYSTDALAEPRVDIVASIPTNTHTPIRYVAVPLTGAAGSLLDHLTGDTARQVFADAGFDVNP